MAPSGTDKILRIGVIQNGKVIEERLIRTRTSVTFGSDAKNTFVFPGDEYPKSWSLFELKGNQYSLSFSEEMDGRLTVNDSNVDFAGLKAQNLAQKQGEGYRVALNDGSRGRVQFTKDMTILFHFVAPPPVAAKPELPVSVRDGWVKSIEPWFTTILTLSFLFHAIFTVVVVNVDPPPPPSREEIIKAIAKVTPQKIETPPPPSALPADNSGKDDGPAKADKPAEADEAPAGPADKAPVNTAAAAKAAEARRAAVREQIAGKGLLAMIGAAGGGDGAVANVFGQGSAIGGDLQASLEGTAGVGIAGGGEVTRRGSGGGGGGGGTGAADVGDLSAGGGGAVSTGQKKAAAVTARVSADAIADVDGTIDQKGVSKALRNRNQAFQSCYETALKQNSKLSGK
ncbi:MAG: hypothetical protein ACO3JL_02980, partial [Myxococcota bacterium]